MSAPRLFAIALFLLCAVGCSTMRDATAPPQTIQRLAALDYPEDAPHGPDLDILLVRSGNQLRLVNRTASSYGGMQLWLNRQWVSEVGMLRPSANTAAKGRGDSSLRPIGSFDAFSASACMTSGFIILPSVW